MAESPTLAALHAKLAAARAKTADVKRAAAAAQERLSATRNALAKAIVAHDPQMVALKTRIDALKVAITRAGAETASIDRGLARDDRRADSAKAPAVTAIGPRGGRYLLLPSGKKLYLAKLH